MAQRTPDLVSLNTKPVTVETAGLALEVLELINAPKDGKDPFTGYACKHHASRSTAPTPACTRDCEVCSTHYHSLAKQEAFIKYGGACSDVEASAMIQGHMSDTTTDFEYIVKLIRAHGDAIAHRWNRRSAQKRIQVQQKAMPEMYRHGLLENNLFHDEIRDQLQKPVSTHRKCWLLPYSTLEELSEDPLRLLALLLYRMEVAPSAWIMFDIERLKLAFQHGNVNPMYNANCVVVDPNSPLYSTLTAWAKPEAHRGDIVGFPRALLGFEAQSHLYRFLRNMVDTLLASSIPQTPAGYSRLKDTVKSAAPSTTDILSTYASRPFLSPSNDLNMTKIALFLQSLRRDTSDNLWLLQTDPLQFREQIAEIERTAYYRGLSPIARTEHILQYVINTLASLELSSIYNRSINVALKKFIGLHQHVRRGQPLPSTYDTSMGATPLLAPWLLQHLSSRSFRPDTAVQRLRAPFHQ